MNLKIFIFITLIFNILYAQQNSTKALNEVAKESCKAKSTMTDVIFIGEPIEFETHMVVLIKGQYLKNYPKNHKGVDVCLYDKKTKKAEISEAFDIKNCQLVQKQDTRFYRTYQYSEDLTLLVSEGDDENRNMGSYCLRFYYYEISSGDFIAGLIRQRDGIVKSVDIRDLNGDKKSEIIVTLETDGSGKSYYVDVFSFDGKQIAFNEELSKKETEKVNIDN